MGIESEGGSLNTRPDELFRCDFDFSRTCLSIIDIPTGIDNQRGDGNRFKRGAAFEQVLQPRSLCLGLGDGASAGESIHNDLFTVVEHLAFAFAGLVPAVGLDGEDALWANEYMIDVEFHAPFFARNVVKDFVAIGVELL